MADAVPAVVALFGVRELLGRKWREEKGGGRIT